MELMHPLHSPDLAKSDYHLFLSTANDLAGEKCTTKLACENRVSHCFDKREASLLIKTTLADLTVLDLTYSKYTAKPGTTIKSPLRSSCRAPSTARTKALQGRPHRLSGALIRPEYTDLDAQSARAAQPMAHAAACEHAIRGATLIAVMSSIQLDCAASPSFGCHARALAQRADSKCSLWRRVACVTAANVRQRSSG